MDILFKFSGAVYRFEILAMNNFEAHTKAVSKEQAINNFKSQAKRQLGYNNSAKADLDGILTIFYKDTKEEYRYNRGKFYLIFSDFDEANFVILGDKVRYENQLVSLEEAKYLYSSDGETRWYIVYANGYREDITNSVRVSGACIIFNDEDYLFDDDEGVYWKHGIPFSDRIEEA